MKYILALLVLLPCAAAEVVISQVLYDPLGTESGGEAIELQNKGAEPVDIGGWVLATESSNTDATIPSGTTLFPGDTYLVADKGWKDKKDNASWKDADHEEAITLGNSNSGVALKDSDTIIDSLGWGNASAIDDGLYETTPAPHVQPGHSLLRIGDTDDNSEDFIIAPPSFYPGILIPVTAQITFTERLEVPDSLHIGPRGVLTLTNHATKAVDITLHVDDLWSEKGSISKQAIRVNETTFRVEATQQYNVSFQLNAPRDALPGTYNSLLRVQYQFE